jgi:7-cyano-7-deazaguanine synthase
MTVSKALVLFSGGQDSTTCLALALDRHELVETVGFDYGQRHQVELGQREIILKSIRRDFPAWCERLGEDHVVRIDALRQISQTAMTHDIEIKTGASGLPNTFVPGRNLLFLTFAAALAYRRGLKYIFGVNLGMDARFVLETPLMWIDKSETFRLAEALGGKALIDLIVEETHSCYLGERALRHEWGYGCGTCPACKLRADGWQKYRASSGLTL